MPKTLTSKFLTRYPGPFANQDGSDGVDATFDIFCRTTGDHIVSTFYWDARLESELKANVVTGLLNTLVPDEEHDWISSKHELSDSKIAAFRGMHPGPYRSAKCNCEYRGPGYEVRSETTSNCVVYVYDRSYRGQAKLVTAVIAELLNDMP